MTSIKYLTQDTYKPLEEKKEQKLPSCATVMQVYKCKMKRHLEDIVHYRTMYDLIMLNFFDKVDFEHSWSGDKLEIVISHPANFDKGDIAKMSNIIRDTYMNKHKTYPYTDDAMFDMLINKICDAYSSIINTIAELNALKKLHFDATDIAQQDINTLVLYQKLSRAYNWLYKHKNTDKDLDL